MNLECKLLLYLDTRRYLIDIKRNCEFFLEQLNEKNVGKFPPLRYLLEIDVMHLLDAFPDLGDFLLREPLKWQILCNDLLFACLQSANLTNKYIEYDQVAMNMSLISVPKFKKNNPQNYNSLITFEGVLISVSKQETYVYHSVWSCHDDCEDSQVILHDIPKIPPKCYICKSVLFENSGLRHCSERVIATFKLNDKISKNFILVHDFIQKLKLGSKYILHAVVMKKLTDVWGLEEVFSVVAPITTPIPKNIKELYNACNDMPWKFIYCLASSIGINVCPLNCFMHLKTCLLLSLCSIKAANAITGVSILHILVAGFDTRYVGELMTEAAKLADRSVFIGTTSTVASTALIASSGGVCVMPLPLHIYNQKQTSVILSAIESGEINTATCNAKLKSAIWGQGMDFKKIILFNVASVFGNICRGDYGEYYDDIADFNLQYAVEPPGTSDEDIETLESIRVYIDLVAHIEVILDAAAEGLLRKYFLAARKEKLKGVTAGTMATLVGNCITSARLCRRSVTNIEDAVLAIWLHVCGAPNLGIVPEEYIRTPADVKKLERIISNFKDWLNDFIDDNIL